MKNSSEAKLNSIELLENAIGEFREFGKVVSAKCDSCGSLIKIVEIRESAWSVQCSCGKFNDTLRGI